MNRRYLQFWVDDLITYKEFRHSPVVVGFFTKENEKQYKGIKKQITKQKDINYPNDLVTCDGYVVGKVS